ncbi:MAG: hypothetical protein KJ818_03570, partial [Candidatus Omnitrophica bacterium]|nr:hypothetical protein [Candidatus Omnitrophota bacterium]
KKNFPWKDLFLGFVVPKVILFIGISRNLTFVGGSLAFFWCLIVFLAGYRQGRKINVFAVIAVLMILARVIIVIAKNNPILYLYVMSLDNLFYGVVFLISCFFRRSLIQVFAEASGANIPEEIRKSPYYSKAWRIVTAAWGIVYFATAVILALLKLSNVKFVAGIDMLTGWPTMIALIFFTIQFPKWYWRTRIKL